MNNTVQKISVAAGCTALSLGLGLLDANPADASLIGDEFDYVINVGENETSGTDTVEEDNFEIFFFLNDVLALPDVAFSEGLIDIQDSTITGLMVTDVFSEEFDIAHSLTFSDLNWVDSDGTIVDAQLTQFTTEVDSPAEFTDVSMPSLTFTGDSVTLLFNTIGFEPDIVNPESSFLINFEITLDVDKSVPEPSSLISLAALGILGTGATFRRKLKFPKPSKDSLK